MSTKQYTSPSSLKAALLVVRRKVTIQETNDSWGTIEQGILQLTECCKNGGCQFVTEMIIGVRSLSRPLICAINSSRSRVSGSAIDLISALVAGLGPSFEPLVSLFFPSLLRLCAQTSRSFTRRAKACVFAVIRGTQSPSLLPYLAEFLHHKTASLRLVAAEGVLASMNCVNPIHIERHSRILEDIIRLTAQDASADVRKAGAEISLAYKDRFDRAAERLRAPLATITKKQLAVKGTAASQARPGRSLIPQRVTSGKPTTQRPQPEGKSADEQPRVVIPIPTVRSAENGRTETARATRMRKGGPPPFKPISCATGVVSTSDPVTTDIPSDDSSSTKTVWGGWPVTKCPKPTIKGLSGEKKMHDNRKPSIPTTLSSCPARNTRHSGSKASSSGGGSTSESTTPKGEPPVRNVRRPYTSRGDSTSESTTPKAGPPVRDIESTTPTGEPPVRDARPSIDATRSRCVKRKSFTSTTPKTPITWPAHCDDLFAPSSNDAYVTPACVSDRLKRAPRIAYRPPRVDATPSPCVPCLPASRNVAQILPPKFSYIPYSYTR
ncbi:hypothetical protein K503DRAFT_210722 [Rhizopogon vinicolor AM-OR11-026]|uniref:TOG domain-containing protein n=1 Tax=Rhizopogon vinicolor AM-OR11-026 TaxID=1314800 RepID=A0A1B7NE75_9AGAM|nr:hypothetical protein K503DRAFT_210722 [Rhizopogon vinicolor AM-OR11-026]